jgi:hypothetical protein
MLEVGTITVVHTDLTSSFIPSEQVIKVGRPILAFESFPTPTNPHSHLEQQNNCTKNSTVDERVGAGSSSHPFPKSSAIFQQQKPVFPKKAVVEHAGATFSIPPPRVQVARFALADFPTISNTGSPYRKSRPAQYVTDCARVSFLTVEHQLTAQPKSPLTACRLSSLRHHDFNLSRPHLVQRQLQGTWPAWIMNS